VSVDPPARAAMAWKNAGSAHEGGWALPGCDDVDAIGAAGSKRSCATDVGVVVVAGVVVAGVVGAGVDAARGAERADPGRKGKRTVQG
jgi:hypothetical protein